MWHRRAGLVAAMLLLWAGVGTVARTLPVRQDALAYTYTPSLPPAYLTKTASASLVFMNHDHGPRNFGDLLGEAEESPKTTATSAHAAEQASTATAAANTHGEKLDPLLGGTTPLRGLLPLTGTSKTSSGSTTTTSGTATITPAAVEPVGPAGQGGIHSIIGTPPPTLAKPTYSRPTDRTNLVTTTASPTVLAPQPAANSAGAVSMPSGSSKGTPSSTWRVIGVAVSAVSAVGAGILAVVFFDQWWGFVRECCGKRKRMDGVEELVPDWEKRDWEWKNEGGRFPNFGTPPTTGTIGQMEGSGQGVGYGQGQGGQSRWSKQLGKGRTWWDAGGAGGGHPWQAGAVAPASLATAYGVNGKHYSVISTNLAGLGLNSLGVLPPTLTPGTSPHQDYNARSPPTPAPVLVRPTAKHAAAPVRPYREPGGLLASSTTKSTFIPEDVYGGLAR